MESPVWVSPSCLILNLSIECPTLISTSSGVREVISALNESALEIFARSPVTFRLSRYPALSSVSLASSVVRSALNVAAFPVCASVSAPMLSSSRYPALADVSLLVDNS